jgi:hypothetical protein
VVGDSFLGFCGVRARLMPAYAGTGVRGGISARGIGGLGSRRHRFWFGVVGLIALALPYASLITATVRAIANPPAAQVTVPELALPVARFPALALPKAASAAPARGAGASTMAPAARTVTHAGARRGVRTVHGGRHVVGRRVITRHVRRIPVVTDSLSLAPPPIKPKKLRPRPSRLIRRRP